MIRIGEPWRPGIPYRDRRGAYGLIAGPAGLLCVWQEDELQLPGGGIDPGESPLRALHREVMEETGWIVGHLRRFAAWQRFNYLPDYGYWARKVQTVYLARAVRRTDRPLEPGHRPVWLTPPEAAARLSVAGDRAMVARALRAGLV